MARLRDCLLRLTVTIRSLLFWSLVYCYCGLCASVYLLKLLWSIGKGPAQTFRRAAREHPPACLNDPSLGTHCYVRIKDSGLRFHYVAAGERGKPLMLLLHGFPEFWYSWRHQLREFKSEYRVVALDLRGYGETDAPIHRENYKLDCLITDIKDILDSLGYSKCVLIGHDWGGMIAWLIAICYPEMVMKLIVINFPHPNVFTEYILRHPAQLFKSSHYYFFQIPWFPEFMFSINDFKALKHLFTSQSTGIGRKGCRLTTEDLEAYIYVFSQPGALSGPINHYRNIFSCLPLKHHMVTIPTLLLWGEKDAFMEVEMAEVTKIYVKNYFRLTILSEVSHWLQQEQPDIVNKLIWTFLKEETRKKD
ncbi:epoxide hydrolase 4 [Mirounga angustirostris]|uniref:Epoxide hydrolase 4 n=2 Tax=Monachinae TaxID=3410119 RepID=A0A2U3XBS5_LEPWE|nr:epoxide hydrolase 4 [Leptonychotes weddellii]XP_021545901.1 epoxide hydrolase 4 [Neomonachus schauinslandi]XP_045751346.1 epoxide hydrolase 4 [Mirounga angustirostris]